MPFVPVPRPRLLEQLNAHFSAEHIRETARIINALPPTARLGDISIALGIIPRGTRADWRKVTGGIPIAIGAALMGAIRGYLAPLGRRGARSEEPKAIHFNITDGRTFGLSISEDVEGMRIELTMAIPARSRR
jgi:hypothetical protein